MPVTRSEKVRLRLAMILVWRRATHEARREALDLAEGVIDNLRVVL